MKRMTLKAAILQMVVAATGLSFTFCAAMEANAGDSKHIKGATAITEVFEDGQQISAVAVEYDKAVVNAKLNQAVFSVEGRTVAKVYANSSAAKAANGTDGRYVIIELAKLARTSSGGQGGGPGGAGGPGGQTGQVGTGMQGGPGGQGGPGEQGGPGGQQPGQGGSSGQGGPGGQSGPGGSGNAMQEAQTPLKASVTQVGEVIVSGGEKYPPETDAVESTGTINLVVDDFQQFTFKDAETGLDLMYNLYIPKNYDRNKSYPMVLFIHDASLNTNQVTATLTKCFGAVVWAMPSEQAKHEAFVLAPQYSRGAVVNDNSEYSSDLDITVRLVKDVAGRYSVDKDRIYTTGQSMGCMMSIAMQIKYPDLFAASMLVAGQWDAQKMKAIAQKNMWILVGEGDTKAFPGMTASTAAMEEAGGKVSRAKWNARAGKDEMAANVRKMIDEGNNIKFVVFEKGTVFPEGSAQSGNEHMQSFPKAYSIEGVRDWLFMQKK